MAETAMETTNSLKTQKTSEQRLRDAQTIKVALAEMACYRGAVAPIHYLNVFSARLAKENLVGVLVSLERLGEAEVREGETLLPSLGKILSNRPVRDSWES